MRFANKIHSESANPVKSGERPAGTIRGLADKPVEKRAPATQADLPEAVMALAGFCKAEGCLPPHIVVQRVIAHEFPFAGLRLSPGAGTRVSAGLGRLRDKLGQITRHRATSAPLHPIFL